MSAPNSTGEAAARAGQRSRGVRRARSDPDRLTDAFSIQLGLLGLSREELTEALQAVEP
jgi:hypothetical protein